MNLQGNHGGHRVRALRKWEIESGRGALDWASLAVRILGLGWSWVEFCLCFYIGLRANESLLGYPPKNFIRITHDVEFLGYYHLNHGFLKPYSKSNISLFQQFSIQTILISVEGGFEHRISSIKITTFNYLNYKLIFNYWSYKPVFLFSNSWKLTFGSTKEKICVFGKQFLQLKKCLHSSSFFFI